MAPTAVEKAANIAEDWKKLGGRDGTKGALAVAWKDRWKAIIEARQQRAPRLTDLEVDLTD